MGSFLILNQIGNKTKKQIELDQLTGRMAIELRAALITMDESEKRLLIAKSVMIAGCMDIFACPAFTKAYELQKKIENGIQLMAENYWNAHKITWLAYQPLLSSKSMIPSIQESSTRRDLKIKIKLGSLISTSQIWKQKEGLSHAWKIAWAE